MRLFQSSCSGSSSKPSIAACDDGEQPCVCEIVRSGPGRGGKTVCWTESCTMGGICLTDLRCARRRAGKEQSEARPRQGGVPSHIQSGDSCSTGPGSSECIPSDRRNGGGHMLDTSCKERRELQASESRDEEARTRSSRRVGGAESATRGINF